MVAHVLVSLCVHRNHYGYWFCRILVYVFGILLTLFLQQEHTKYPLGPSTQVQNHESWYPFVTMTLLVTPWFGISSAEVEQV